MKILLLAGEESGVLYARQIRAEILRRHPSAEIRGYEDEGFRIEDLAVMGFGQVLRRLFYFLGVKRKMEQVIDTWQPHVVCTIDYPGLNLKLAAYAKARGSRTVHVVCPQVWAWKKGRIPKIEASLDVLCCFFPFEPSLFRPGFATFVGHPLVEEMRDEGRGKRDEGRGMRDEGRVLAVLPGSRMGEIEKHTPILLEVVKELLKDAHLSSTLKVVIPAANERAFRSINDSVADAALSSVIEVCHGGARDVLRMADAAVVASGTATLEAALALCPTVLVYRVGWFFAALARLVVKGVKHIGLANIVAEKAGRACPMPELLQENFTAEKVLAILREWLTDDASATVARNALMETMKLLRSDGGAIERIVDRLGI